MFIIFSQLFPLGVVINKPLCTPSVAFREQVFEGWYESNRIVDASHNPYFCRQSYKFSNGKLNAPNN